MSRIRSIKPEFCESESIGRLTLGARLLFLHLFTIVDDDGRARAAPRMLVGHLYPYDDDVGIDDIEQWLAELEAQEHIRSYEVNGSQYLEIINWAKHQKIDHKTASKLPPSTEGTPISRMAGEGDQGGHLRSANGRSRYLRPQDRRSPLVQSGDLVE
jgi:hypothetical protein